MAGKVGRTLLAFLMITGAFELVGERPSQATSAVFVRFTVGYYFQRTYYPKPGTAVYVHTARGEYVTSDTADGDGQVTFSLWGGGNYYIKAYLYENCWQYWRYFNYVVPNSYEHTVVAMSTRQVNCEPDGISDPPPG